MKAGTLQFKLSHFLFHSTKHHRYYSIPVIPWEEDVSPCGCDSPWPTKESGAQTRQTRGKGMPRTQSLQSGARGCCLRSELWFQLICNNLVTRRSDPVYRIKIIPCPFPCMMVVLSDDICTTFAGDLSQLGVCPVCYSLSSYAQLLCTLSKGWFYLVHHSFP